MTRRDPHPYAGLYLFRLSEEAVEAARVVKRHPREHPRSVLMRRVTAAVNVELRAGRLQVVLKPET